MAGCSHIVLIAPTQADIRDVMIEGPSGILETAWEYDVDNNGRPMGVPTYVASKRHRLTWANGATAMGYSAEKPDRLRGLRLLRCSPRAGRSSCFRRRAR